MFRENIWKNSISLHDKVTFNETDIAGNFLTLIKDISKNPTPLGEGNGTPLQYSCLENPMDGGAW